MLPVAAALLSLGILLGRSSAGWYGLAGASALGMLLCLWPGDRRLGAAVLVLCLGTGLGYAAWHPAAPSTGNYQISGIVSDEVTLGERNHLRTKLTALKLDGARTAGEAYWTCYLPEGQAAPLPGQQVCFSGSLYLPEGEANPGGFDFREYLLARGITWCVYGCQELACSPAERFTLQGFFAGLRHRWAEGLTEAMGEEAGGYAAAMLLGVRSLISDEDQDAFSRLGIAHVLSVSGFHVGVLVLLLNLLLIRLGFTWPQPFTLFNWLAAPWTKLYVLSFAVPAWYLIALFLAELYFAILRTCLQRIVRNPLAMEIICLLLCLALGFAALYVHSLPGVSETASVYLRSVLMLFFIQAGVFYRRYLEALDHLGNLPCFLIIFLTQFLIILLSGNSRLSPGLYGLIGFESFGYDYFLAGLTGVALYLRISRLLASIPGRNRLILFLGSNTLYIMSFHIFGFFLLNELLRLLKDSSFFPGLFADFSSGRWHSYLYYTMTENPRMIPMYLLAGVSVSALLAWVIRAIKRLIS